MLTKRARSPSPETLGSGGDATTNEDAATATTTTTTVVVVAVTEDFKGSKKNKRAKSAAPLVTVVNNNSNSSSSSSSSNNLVVTVAVPAVAEGNDSGGGVAGSLSSSSNSSKSYVNGGKALSDAEAYHLLSQATPPSSPSATPPPLANVQTGGGGTIAAAFVAETPRFVPNGKGNNEHGSGMNTNSSEKIEFPLVGEDPFENWREAVGPRYELVKLLGHGSYGEVAEAIDKGGIQVEPGVKKIVAIKRINGVFDLDIDTKRILREVYILRHLSRPPQTETNEDGDSPRTNSSSNNNNNNIVRLLNIITPKTENFNELYLVLEHAETDLHKLLQSPQHLSVDHIKFFLYQTLCALKFMHSALVIHRDLKPANILLNEDCSLKVCDFGLARVVERVSSTATTTDATKSDVEDAASSSSPSKKPKLQRQMTKHVVTRWYRSPELILLQEYNDSVDMWAVGCIFAEMLMMEQGSTMKFNERTPLFPGRSCFPLSADNDKTYKDRLDQLNMIFDIIGTPKPEDIEHLGDVKNYLKGLKPTPPKNLSKMFPVASKDAIELLKRMLEFNPLRRITVDEALAHDYLKSIRSELTTPEPVADFVIPSLGENTLLTKEGVKLRLFKEIAMYLDDNKENFEKWGGTPKWILELEAKDQ